MKKIGVLHGELSKCIATMGHGDMILIADAGMPVPKGVPLIDLALVEGVPDFSSVLGAVLKELCVQEGIVSSEMRKVSPHIGKKLDEIIDGSFKTEEVTHDRMKVLSKDVKAIVRTGEFTPYANIILTAGVIF